MLWIVLERKNKKLAVSNVLKERFDTAKFIVGSYFSIDSFSIGTTIRSFG